MFAQLDKKALEAIGLSTSTGRMNEPDDGQQTRPSSNANIDEAMNWEDVKKRPRTVSKATGLHQASRRGL